MCSLRTDDRISPPSGLRLGMGLGGKRQANIASISTPTYPTFLPLWIGLPKRVGYTEKGKGRALEYGFNLTRRRCEDGLLLSGIAWGIWKLGHEWHEVAIAGGAYLLLVCSQSDDLC